MTHVAMWVVFLLTMTGALGYVAIEARAQTVARIEHAPRGAPAPTGGALNPDSNVHGGLYDRRGGNGLAPSGYFGHLVGEGGCNVPGPGENGVGSGQLGPMGGACPDTSPAENWVLVDQVAQALLGPGAQYNVNLRGAPNKDRFGRHAHVTGIKFAGTFRFIEAGGANPVYNGYQQLGSAYQNIVLQDCSGWHYIQGSDMRDLVDDRWLRSFSQQIQAGAPPIDIFPIDIPVNSSAGNYDRDVTVFFPLTIPYSKGHEAMLGSIPLAMLQDAGDTAIGFTAGGALVGAPQGLTGGGFIGITEVWLRIQYLDKMFLDRPWQLETYTDANLANNAHHVDRTHEYVVVRPLPEDNGGQYINDYLGAQTFQVAGETVATGLTLAQWGFRTEQVIAEDDPRYEDCFPTLRNPNADGSRRFGFIVGPVPRRRAAMAGGVVSYLFTARTRTSTRLLHRTVACQNIKRILASKPGTAIVGLDHNGLAVLPDKMLPVLVK